MSEQTQDQPAPAGLGPRGAKFYSDVCAEFEFSRDEGELLLEAARALDVCERLAAIVARDGELCEGSAGQPRLHPAVGELRMARLCAGRLLAQLDLDSDLVSSATAQRRGATGARWARARVGSTVSDQARDAASTRWARERGSIA